MTDAWRDETRGLMDLPSGRRVRGRGLRAPVGDQVPTLAVHVTHRPTSEPPWPRLWVRWPDFWLPTNPAEAMETLTRAHVSSDRERVEIACAGGVGRTGTALAALCVLEGLSPDDAVRWVRSRYHRRAVEVRWQRRFLRYVQARA